MVLFGAKRLPDASRSLGRSMRIFKAETKGLRDDDTETTAYDAREHDRQVYDRTIGSRASYAVVSVSSSSRRPLVSALKIRIERPSEREASGSRLAPNRTMITSTTRTSSQPPGNDMGVLLYAWTMCRAYARTRRLAAV
jgi:sec-independent protein translocase protein TatA